MQNFQAFSMVVEEGGGPRAGLSASRTPSGTHVDLQQPGHEHAITLASSCPLSSPLLSSSFLCLSLSADNYLWNLEYLVSNELTDLANIGHSLDCMIASLRILVKFRS